ncbi:MAG: hypothetical protein JWM28_414, partial [Chitinophagaceae bacterium]|nr:hypothetical protein [Chitinophagaceae bacterium]
NELSAARINHAGSFFFEIKIPCSVVSVLLNREFKTLPLNGWRVRQFENIFRRKKNLLCQKR